MANAEMSRIPSEIITLTTTIEQIPSIEGLPLDEQELLRLAYKARETAYAPYSHFKVGAALLLSDGTVVGGSNVENASYPLTICAERSAIATANALGKVKDIQKIAVMGSADLRVNEDPVTPCGACRQVINEFEQYSPAPYIIIMSGTEGKSPIWRVNGIAELLQKGFGPKDLGLA